MRPRLLQSALPAAHATILRFGCFRLFSSFTSPIMSIARVWPAPQLERRATLGSMIACSAWESAFSSSAMWPCKYRARCWQRWSARGMICTTMIVSGLLTALTAVVHTPAQLYFARSLLGAAEAGFFPSVIVYLSHWFIQEDQYFI